MNEIICKTCHNNRETFPIINCREHPYSEHYADVLVTACKDYWHQEDGHVLMFMKYEDGHQREYNWTSLEPPIRPRVKRAGRKPIKASLISMNPDVDIVNRAYSFLMVNVGSSLHVCMSNKIRDIVNG